VRPSETTGRTEGGLATASGSAHDAAARDGDLEAAVVRAQDAADGIQRSTADSSTVRKESTRSGHGAPAANGVRSPQMS
jgi:hypothetical protein